jgi:hypothetical protein
MLTRHQRFSFSFPSDDKAQCRSCCRCEKIQDNEGESLSPLTADHCSLKATSYKYTCLVLILAKAESVLSIVSLSSATPSAVQLTVYRLLYHICIMSDTDTGSDSESDSNNVRVDVDDASISSSVREHCNRLRSDDPRVSQGPNDFLDISSGRSEAECIGVAQALQENTSVKRIILELLQNTKRSTKAVAKYVKASKHLQSVTLRGDLQSQVLLQQGEVDIAATEYPAFSVLLRALSRNTSVTELNLDALDAGFASAAFQKLLTRTQTLQKLQISSLYQFGEFDEMQRVIVVSAFANNTTLCELELIGCERDDLAPVLAALQDHPTLQTIHFRSEWSGFVSSLSGLEVLLRSQDSKVKELVLVGVEIRTVGLQTVMQELGRNTKVADLTICGSTLSRENVQQLKFMFQVLCLCLRWKVLRQRRRMLLLLLLLLLLALTAFGRNEGWGASAALQRRCGWSLGSRSSSRSLFFCFFWFLPFLSPGSTMSELTFAKSDTFCLLELESPCCCCCSEDDLDSSSSSPDSSCPDSFSSLGV